MTSAQWVNLAYDHETSISVSSAGQIDTALRHPTVWRSVNKIAGMVAQMPFHAYNGAKMAGNQPAIVRNPSAVHRPSAWKRAAVTSMLLKGGAYGLTTRSARGGAETCELIHPDRVSWTPENGWMIDNEPAPAEWPLGSFWQVPYMVLPGSPKGVGAIEYARRTTYAGMAAAEFGGNFFRDGAHPTSVITAESNPGPEGAQVIKDKVNAAVSGTNRDALVLPAGLSFEQIQINPEDSQFIDLMGFSGGQVAGFFGLMPQDVGLPIEGTGLDYSNRENRQQDRLQDAIMPVVIPLEEAVTELAPNGQTVKASPEGLLRSDLLTRYQSYEISARVEQATGKPILTNEEIRGLENREPIPTPEDS